MITIHKRIPGRRVSWLAAMAGFILASALLEAPAYAESAVSVLCYHSFLEKKKMDPFSFTIDELNSQIMQLKKEGFRFVSISDVVSGRITGTKNILVTIDDGNKSVYDAYRKVFRPNGIKPLLGIYPNIIINKKHYALTWEQLIELANSGCDVAAHGYFHLKINKKLYDKNPSYFNKEIFLVKKVLEEKLNRKITVFLYPFGLRDDFTIAKLREAGYHHAFTINNGRIDIPLTRGDRLFELPRYMVTRTSWKYCFNSVVKNARHRTAYKVAAAADEAAEKTGMNIAARAPSERHDPAAELQARLVESIEKAAVPEMKADRKEKQVSDSHSKKKIEKKDGIDSEEAPVTAMKIRTAEDKPPLAGTGVLQERRTAARERLPHPTASREKVPSPAPPSSKKKTALIPERESTTVMVPPIQRVPGNVKPDIFDPERSGLMSTEKKHASLVPVDAATRGGSASAAAGGAVLQARVEKGRELYLVRMKDQYYGINTRSIKTYRGFLGLVNDKVERIKHTIRKYVLSNF